MLRRGSLAFAALAAALACASAASAQPIPDTLAPLFPKFQGAAASPTQLSHTRAPQNPFMAPNPRSNIHNDTWMTDAYQVGGPARALARRVLAARCPGAVRLARRSTRAGYIVSVCPSLIAAPQARVIDPVTLEVLATYDMPNAPDPPGTKAYQNFAGGGYFFLDERDRIWSSTKTSHLFVLQVSPDGRSITQAARLRPDQRARAGRADQLGAARLQGPDLVRLEEERQGRRSSTRRRGRIRAIRLGEDIQNSFTVDRRGVYIVSSKRMYRFRAQERQAARQWRARYRNSGIVKPGQADAGSGTTPTIMRGGYVAITDNADPMNVVVYRKAVKLRRGQRRVVCTCRSSTRARAPPRTR